ncbi:serine/threonine transporter SstT [Campylobacter corcagiensis]|uniref:Serine/threonine transporter SstT n=1 Tax=Campylobacter corcagiensis TaxID=1448857 RepID=A0A7M1LFJ1_9BACT|nr:serine/threonine transporter SstT [Campylobacter corcagiensis]QKF65002.1 sodium ion-motive force-driven serine/threonine transporter [Campylobacter corcagiensis]QOQ86844.1 serine/threonine transporter SstT [Campylobacter corcagiensis]
MSLIGSVAKSYKEVNLVARIFTGVVIGAIIGFLVIKFPDSGFIAGFSSFIMIFGDLFVAALKAVAPILVFILITTSFIVKDIGDAKGLKLVIVLYIVATLIASTIGVLASFIFPTTLILSGVEAATNSTPAGLSDVIKTLLFNILSNPFDAIAKGNYMGILAWAVAIGLALKISKQGTKDIFNDLSDAITKIVQVVIQFAPFGIMGLVAASVATAGVDALLSYLRLILVLVGAMAFVALVTNPIIVGIVTKKNPYPLLFTTLKESGIYAFFTRSSAANIPVNLNLCKKLGISDGLYSITIPLGATINMTGAAVVIAILALSAAQTLGIEVSFGSALLLCFFSALGACGAGGIAGGSLMLIPLATSLFGISNDIAMQVIGVGFIVGVIQDSVETAINSSSDVLFTAAAHEATK